MRYYRVGGSATTRLIVEDGRELYDLTSADGSIQGFSDVCKLAVEMDQTADEVSRDLIDDSAEVPASELSRIIEPVHAKEIWAAGVTYEISEEARKNESGMPEMYLDVYEGERPEVFFKSTPNRTVGPDEKVGIRSDSHWDVPEPELGIVLFRDEIVGYTIGNDMSSRSIEGENPLYLPQAKVYDRCCSIGPCIASPQYIDDPHDLQLSMRIKRDGETMYNDTTSTSKMVRSCEELVSYYTRHNDLPETAILLTGTSLVPSDEFTLEENDTVTIEIENIGTLENDVITV